MPDKNRPKFLVSEVAFSQFTPFFTMSLISETIPVIPDMMRATPPYLTCPSSKNAAPTPSAKPLRSLVTLAKLAPFCMMSWIASFMVFQESKNRANPVILKPTLPKMLNPFIVESHSNALSKPLASFHAAKLAPIAATIGTISLSFSLSSATC